MKQFHSLARIFPHNLLVLTLSITILPFIVSAQKAASPPNFRLPGNVIPERYRLELTLIPDQNTFTGVVEIDLNFLQASQEIWLNGDQLEIKESKLTRGNQTFPSKLMTTPDDFVGFSFAHSIPPGRAKLRIAYEGKIDRKDMQGVFQIKDADQWYIFSQFEEISARRAFPCFDEPNYKVPWQVNLLVKKEHTALSNAPMVSASEEKDGMKRVTFAETQPLPSYLVALAVGPFEIVNAGTAGRKKTQIQMVVPKGRSRDAQYAIQSTPAILNLLEDYFGIPYPYEKLDQVAIPLAGFAMEHPGLVTYGAQILLSKPEQDTLSRKRDYASVAAHELAHMWFGDLVTTAWWDDTWLNEGFASWMGNKIVNQFQPEWKMNLTELNSYEGAMGTDSLVSARKVRQPIESGDDIRNAFDGITYNKGSALLAMFENFIGPEKFREGIRRYLLQYSGKNATSAEFLAALGASNQSLTPAFLSFLDQAGVPLLSVQFDCSHGVAQLNLSQERFLPAGSSGSANQTWQFPVCVKYNTGSITFRECTLLTQKTGQLLLPNSSGCPEWVFANANASGYYRVVYQGDLLNRILKEDAKTLNLPEKIALIGNISALVDSGKTPLGEALALMSRLAKDPASEVVTKTMRISAGLEEKIVPTVLVPAYRRYLLNLYGERARQLSWKSKNEEDDDTHLLRPRLLSIVANQAEDRELIEQAKLMARQWLDNRQGIDPDMLDTVLYTAARHGDRALFERFRIGARKEKEEGPRQGLIGALGSFREPEIIKEALPIVLTDEFDVRESLSILFSASTSSSSRDLTFRFVQQNWEALVSKMPSDNVPYLPYIAAGYSDTQQLAAVESFFQGRSTKFTGGPRILAQALEGIKLAIAFKTTHQASVNAFLEHY
jgi:cytosol alanyl aminopeptidase